jgi:hypothetical protein
MKEKNMRKNKKHEKNMKVKGADSNVKGEKEGRGA